MNPAHLWLDFARGWVAIGICRTQHGNNHTGIAYRASDGQVMFFHQAFHRMTRNQPIEEAIRDCGGPFFCIFPDLADDRARAIAAFCEYVAMQNLPIQYTLEPDEDAFYDDETGRLVLPNGLGLSCSTFVLVFFRSVRLRLIDTTAWPKRRPGDEKAQQELVALLRRLFPDELDHINAVERQIGCERVRPEEAAGAALHAALPIRHPDAEDAGLFVNGGLTLLGRRGESTSRKHIADLQAVLKVSRELAIVADLTPLLRTVQRAALDVLECERATVFLYDAARHELYSRIASDVDEIRFSADRGIAGEAFRTGQVIHVPDAYADPRFNPEIDRATGFRTRNMIAFPLLGLDNKTVGVLQVLNKAEGSFDPWDDELVRTFGAQVGMAVQRQLLLEHYADKQRLQRDLSIAREIQQSLIPKKAAAIDGFDVAGWNKPADETGGDCFDYLTLPDGSLALIIADATGHGIGPALIMAECRALFRATISLSHDLSQVMGHVNSLLCADLPDDRFVTAFFGLLDPRQGTLSYLSAGHGPIIQYVRATDEFSELPVSAMPLGIQAGLAAESDRVTLGAGDMIVLVTDGFIECCNPAGEQYGVPRVHQHVRRLRDRPCSEMIESLYREVQTFAAGAPQADDLTAIIIRKL